MSAGGGLDSNSPYFVPPPSTRALRLSLVVLLIAPTLLIIGAGVAVAFRVWWGLAVMLVLVLGFARPRYRVYQSIHNELNRRKAEQLDEKATPSD